MVQTLIVLGDVYETNAIVQTNSYRDNDLIHHSAQLDEPGTTIESGGNIANNIAALVAENPAADIEFEFFDGGKLHIDYDEGDFYDIKVLKQYNAILDNDVVVQTGYDAYSKFFTGQSDLENSTDIYDASLRYDLIIVGGDYHKVNLIGQTNVILDDDVIKVGKGHDGDGDGTSEVYGGYNWLLNNAKIHDLGESDFGLLDDFEDLKNFSDLLKDGLATLDDIPSDLPGMHGMSFNVLFAKGNYYDFNVVWQHNTIVDIDGALQYFGGWGEEGDHFKQFASTGHNLAKNKAEIIDIGTLDKQYVGGSHYQESILVQVDILKEDNDSVVYGDTTKLVTEVIAFTETAEETPSSDDGAGLGVAAAHHDLLGNLLS
jgi:hypothetical protein